MKHLLYFPILLIAFFGISSCNLQNNPNTLLAKADSLMEKYPDSALHILENVQLNQLEDLSCHAYYALLLTQARDKNYIVQTNDSLIKIAVQYYDSIENASMQAKAYYYKGCIYRDANLCGKAIQEYLTAITFAEKVGNIKLLGLIYNHAGYLYNLQNLLEKAELMYKQAEKLAIQQNDTSLLAEVLSSLGNIKRGLAYYAIAEEKLLKAFAMTNATKYKLVQADITASLSILYTEMKQGEKAIRFAKHNIALRNNKSTCYRAYSTLGYAYFEAGKYDSATLYINKSLPSKMYDLKANAYMLLATIAKIKGDIDESLVLTEKQILYTDSITLSQQSNDMLSAEKELDRQRYTKSINNRYHKNEVLIILSILIICTIISFCFFYMKHKRDADKLKVKQAYLEKERQELQQEYIRLKNKLNLKNSEIASLKKSFDVHNKLIQQKLETTYKEREVLAKETFEHSEIYAKMERIIKSCKKYDKSDEKMNEEDWIKLIAETNTRWDGAIIRLDSLYKLSKKELHLCCLYLTDIPLSNLEFLIEYKRSSIYRKEKDIIKLMGYPQSYKLKDILKNI